MEDTSRLHWTEIRRRRVYTSPILTVLEARHRNIRGDEGDFTLVESPDWVNVIAITQDSRGRRCFVMVRQYRHGEGRLALEFPGGLVDSGESPDDAVRRELTEETGYTAKQWTTLGSMNPNPAFMTNHLHCYLAEDLETPGGQNLDPLELLDVELVPEIEILQGRRDDFLVNGVMMIPLSLYQRYREQRTL
ncbi:NUDIX hydrolase [Spirochaeta lutea]|uniref:GDP-mannose pyrophosphatase n=1 Tax=Spirochaeta lutea TaxID=1480694 RepID=A0A098QXR2_9SPIO|nr:NUDIX hydrolase [Spirochaeta lutea]KGE71262.1 hypothetical protein DC28_12510 [Spirochaeta lutea]